MLYQYADNGKKSGRADGNVYMRNGRVRGMTVPSYVSNDATSRARADFSNGSSAAWAALTDAERLSWMGATGHFVSNRFGVLKEISGKELYVQCFANCALVGTTPPDTYPDLLKPLALESLSGAASAGGGTNALTFTATPQPANRHIIVMATSQKRATIYRPGKSLYRLVSATAAAPISPLSIFADYLAKFGALTAGQKIFVRCHVIDDRSGFASASVDAVYTVAA